MEMIMMKSASLGRVSLNMRIRIGRGEGIKEHNCKNGDRLTVFTSQQKKPSEVDRVEGEH
jgi:hypothetical protein